MQMVSTPENHSYMMLDTLVRAGIVCVDPYLLEILSWKIVIFLASGCAKLYSWPINDIQVNYCMPDVDVHYDIPDSRVTL